MKKYNKRLLLEIHYKYKEIKQKKEVIHTIQELVGKCIGVAIDLLIEVRREDFRAKNFKN